MTDRTKKSPDNFWREFLQGKQVSVLEAIQEGVEIVDAAGVVRYINPAFLSIMGLTPPDRLGRNILEVVPDGPLAKVVRTGRPVPGGGLYVQDAGIDIMVSASPITVEGRMVGAVTVFTEFKEARRLVERVEKSMQLVEELNNKLSNAMSAKYDFADIIGQSPVLKRSIETARRAAESEVNVLLLGETGTGKELFAHAIHHTSRRFRRPFVNVNCAAVPEDLLESEFFGHERGAFTGAVQAKLGMFELAEKGSIFLDEIGELGLPLQAKILRVLEEGEMFRVGGTKPMTSDVRVIAATNRDLHQMVQEGRFRRDLFYRLRVLTVEIPPLRRRKEDLPGLVDHFIDLFNRKHGKKISGVSPDALRLLSGYSWPGNVRELKNMLQQAVIMSEGREITPREIEQLFYNDHTLSPDGPVIALPDLEKEMVGKALSQFGSSLEGKKKAAAALKISLRTLYNKINKYGLEI